jgi:hypothetical protein
MAAMNTDCTAIIHVRLEDEGLEVYRPVVATRIGASEYMVLPQSVPNSERWEFAPGTIDSIESRVLKEQTVLVAVARRV